MKIVELLSQWLQNNLDIVFFAYGFAFVVMGIAILVQPKKGSEFPLANILWLLAFFGITHGTNEFLDMWAIIKGRHQSLDLVRWFILLASYFFLFEFGRLLFRLHAETSSQRHKKIAELLTGWVSPVTGMLILAAGFMSPDFWKTGSILTRYLLGFPGGFLIGSGFLLCSCHEFAKELKVRKYFLTAGASFSVYGVLGGLIVPEGDFFPSNYLNNESFLSTVGMPVQVFRALCAVTAAWAVGGMLNIFNWEKNEKLRESQKRLSGQLNENVGLTDNLKVLHDISKDILAEFDITRLLRKIADNSRKLMGSRYAAIGILSDKGGYEYFVTSGMPQEILEGLKASCGLPLGKGILGLLIKSSMPIRIDDMSKHPASFGFPEGHPDMTTFLGVPVILHDKVIGRLYFTDKSPALPFDNGEQGGTIKAFTEEDENLAMSFAATVSLAINNTNILKKIDKSYRTQKVLNALLHVSLEDIPLKEQLQRCLDIILAVPFVRLIPKGGIFLAGDGSGVLDLIANRGLPVPLIGICSRVPFGRCLCGRAAESRQIEFAGCVDDRHDNRYDGLTPHGHYNVPILSKGKVLGVFVLYLKEGHQQKEEEVLFLQTVADTLAGIIERTIVEDELKRYTKELMQFAEASNIIGAISPAEDIYEAICNIAVRNFDLKMAWIGLVEDGSYDIRPIARSGCEEGYLSDIRAAWDDSPAGMGPTGMAVKTRVPHAMHNIDTDPAYAPWREHALKRGYRSSLAIPLVDSEARVFSVLNFYSSSPQFFTKKTERLFITFANHAMSAIENRLLIEGLEERITERTRELNLAKELADDASKAKSDFLSNMSHEMRTPLNAIIGFSEVIHDGLSGEINTKQKEYLKYILDASEQLLSLINDLLDLSRIEAGKMELELSEFHLGEILEVSLAMFKEKAVKHKLQLILEVEEGTERITADARKIKQIMFNLLGNAVKFTPDEGSICVRARRVRSQEPGGKEVPYRDYIEISVEDTGIGISEEDRDKLFQPFQQLDSVLAKKHKGTGLGLSICKRLVELHGGNIRVESVEGDGSRFKFVIPASQGADRHLNTGEVQKT